MGSNEQWQQATLMWDFEGLAIRRKELGNLYISSIVPGYMRSKIKGMDKEKASSSQFDAVESTFTSIH